MAAPAKPKPKPAATPEPGAGASSPEADELAASLHAKFMQLLGDKVAEKQGYLTPADVEAMGREFEAALQDIKTRFVDAVESATTARLKAREDDTRDNVFQRILVHRFEHRIVDDEAELADNPAYLSRRMLPGFFSVLATMFGKQRLAEYEQATKKIVDRMRSDAGGILDWRDVYRAPAITKIVLRAEMEIARNFRNLDKRLAWMIAMVNANMIPPDALHRGPAWLFGEDAANGMLSALFRELRSALKNDSARANFTQQLGEDGVGILDQVVRRFA